jgi:hypothetical protein
LGWHIGLNLDLPFSFARFGDLERGLHPHQRVGWIAKIIKQDNLGLDTIADCWAAGFVIMETILLRNCLR